MAEKLMCPWCGESAELAQDEYHTYSGEKPWKWRCHSCRARGPWRPTRDEAVASLSHVLPDLGARRDAECEALAARADAAEAKLASAEESIRAIAAKECTLCPFLGRGDPAVDESAALLAAERAAHEELREAVEALSDAGAHVHHIARYSSRGRYCVVHNGMGGNIAIECESQHHDTSERAILAWFRSVKK